MRTPRQWLAQLRDSRALSAADFAAELGVSRMTVHRWETGTVPRLAQASDLARYARVTLDEVAAVWGV